MPSYGNLISFHDVEQALIDHMEPWVDGYLGAREAKVGLAYQTISRPASWITKQTFTALPGEENTPAIIVIAPGLADPPKHRGDGYWDVMMRLGVVALCHGPEANFARELAGHYQAALLALCQQQRKVANNIRLEEWEDLAIDDVDDDQARTLCAARLEFVYFVQGFSFELDGPVTPPVDPSQPLPDDPVVETVDIQTGVLP